MIIILLKSVLIIVNDMQNTVNERVKDIIKRFSNDNQASYAISIGVTPTVINNIVGGRMSEPSFQTLLKIIVAYPQISSDWLLLGEGEMLKETINPFYNDKLDTIGNQSNNQQKKTNTYGDITANGSNFSLENMVGEQTTSYQSNIDVAALLKEMEDLRNENKDLKAVIKYLEKKK